MLFGNWGIEHNRKIPNHPDEIYNAANHIRALLDLLELGQFSIAQGMKNDFICTDEYDDMVFEQLSKMRVLSNWKEIDKFLEREYLLQWVDYRETHMH